MSNYPVILGEQMIEPSREVKDEMTRAKMRVLVAFPFLSYPLLNSYVHFVGGDNETFPTAAATVIRGKNDLIFNSRSFIEDFDTPEKRAFLISHEIMHLIYEHSDRARKMNYNPILWSYATDYYINSRLKRLVDEQKNVKSKNLETPDFGLFDDKYLEYNSADEIYYELLETLGKDLSEVLQTLGEKCGSCDNPSNSSGEGSGEDDSNDGSGNSSGNGNQQITNEGNERPFDVVQKEEQDPVHKTENKEIVAVGVNESKKKKMGEGASDLMTELQATLESKVPWHRYLQDFVEKSARSRRTYNHPNRKSGRVVFPSKTGETLRVVFGFDSSGSMSAEDYQQVASELMAVLQQFDEFEVNLLSCDTQVHDLGYWSSEEGDDLEDVEVHAKGMGGTELSPIIQHANQQEEMQKVHCCLVLTDGFIPEEKMDAACRDSEVPVLVVTTSNGNKELSLENALVVNMSD